MKTLNKENYNEYKEMKKYERFIWSDAGFEFFAFKVTDEVAIFINGSGKFIVAKAYTNMLSIGSGLVVEYDTFDEAEKNAEG